MLASLLSLALTAAPPQDPPQQDPPVTRVEDIVVDGRPLSIVVDEFVEEVGEAPRGRGLARWHDPLCVGVANLRGEAAQSVIDHISAVGASLGLRPADPGCTPNVIIVFTRDPDSVAAGVVAADPRAFRAGSRTFHLDGAARDAFLEGDAPVRWWHVSEPTDSLTGQRAARLPGDNDPSTQGGTVEPGRPSAPRIYTTTSSRLTSQIREDLSRVVIVVDIDRTGEITPQQLGDYLAFVALAQIDPRGDRSRQPSVLNVFDNPASSDGFSEWDLAYLRALYRPGGVRRTNPGAISQDVAGEVARTLRREAETP
jgi:hypothetical protein